MSDNKWNQTKRITLDKCPRCSNNHFIDINISYENEVIQPIFGGDKLKFVPKKGTIELELTCPEKGEKFLHSIIVDNAYKIEGIELIPCEESTVIQREKKQTFNELLKKDLENWYINSLNNLYSFCQYMITLNFSILGFYIAFLQLAKNKTIKILTVSGLLLGIIFFSIALLQSLKYVDVLDLVGYSKIRKLRLKRGWYFILVGIILSFLSFLAILIEVLMV
jgi:uncharacterized membrane protein